MDLFEYAKSKTLDQEAPLADYAPQLWMKL